MEQSAQYGRRIRIINPCAGIEVVQILLQKSKDINKQPICSFTTSILLKIGEKNIFLWGVCVWVWGSPSHHQLKKVASPGKSSILNRNPFMQNIAMLFYIHFVVSVYLTTIRCWQCIPKSTRNKHAKVMRKSLLPANLWQETPTLESSSQLASALQGVDFL